MGRWAKDRWRYMLVVFVTEDSDANARLEIAAIGHFRGDRRGNNVAPGGENAHSWHSPFFLYVVCR